MAFVEKNGGILRYVKIRNFFEVIRRENLEIEDLQSWANHFSKLVKEKIIQAESVIGSDFFQIMEMAPNGKPHYSGTYRGIGYTTYQAAPS